MNVDLPLRLYRDKETVLGVPIGIESNRFALTRFTALRSAPGWIVRDNEIQEWYVEGFYVSGGKNFLYGPYYEGFLLEELSSLAPEQALLYLIYLVEALLLLKKRGIPYDYLQTDSIYFLREGGVLFLPPTLMKKVLEARVLDYRLQVFENINHPDIAWGEKKLSYGLAALIYRILTGEFPFQAETSEEVHHRMRYFKLPPPTRIKPDLKEEISGLLLGCLTQERRSLPPLEEWRRNLKDWRRDGIFRNVLDSEKDTIRQQGTLKLKRSLRSYRQRIFWLKHWKRSAVILILLLIAGGVCASFLKNLLAPRATRGYSPRQVVETFYLSINKLDHALMEDCVIGAAGKGIIKEVIQVYVTSRITMGYEGKSHLIPADQWDQMGRPVLAPPQTVFGITDLDIKQSSGEPPSFKATYQKWVPAAVEELSDSPPAGELPQKTGERGPQQSPHPSVQSFQITEELFLKQHKGDWVIYRIDRPASEALEP